MRDPAELGRVLAALPHREPFRFVTELTVLEPLHHAAGVWEVSGREAFFTGHFPGEPIVPGVLIAEALAQLCGLVAFAGVKETSVPPRPAKLAQVDVKVRTAVRPPARIGLSVSFVRGIGGLLLFDVAAEVDGAAAADGRIVLAGPE